MTLQYLFNVFILFDTVFNPKLLKINPIMHIFKNLEEIWKTCKKKFEKMSGNPD